MKIILRVPESRTHPLQSLAILLSISMKQSEGEEMSALTHEERKELLSDAPFVTLKTVTMLPNDTIRRVTTM